MLFIYNNQGKNKAHHFRHENRESYPAQVQPGRRNSKGGKTRLALDFYVENKIVLDADDMREVWPGLGFSKEDRWTQNIRLAGLARMLTIQGFNVCVASICPYAKLRKEIKEKYLSRVTWVYVVGADGEKPSDEYPFEEKTAFICKDLTCSVPMKNGTEIDLYLHHSSANGA